MRRVGEPRNKRYYWAGTPTPFMDNIIAQLIQKEKAGTLTEQERDALNRMRHHL